MEEEVEEKAQCKLTFQGELKLAKKKLTMKEVDKVQCKN